LLAFQHRINDKTLRHSANTAESRYDKMMERDCMSTMEVTCHKCAFKEHFNEFGRSKGIRIVYEQSRVLIVHLHHLALYKSKFLSRRSQT